MALSSVALKLYRSAHAAKTLFKPSSPAYLHREPSVPPTTLGGGTRMTYTCLVCGYPDLKEQPHGESSGGSYEICPSCGFQFGVSDDDRGFTYEQWRQKWIDGGMVWDKGRTKPPANWNPQEQL
jgi:hypothetical protein